MRRLPALTITAGPLPTGDNVEAYDAAVQYVVAQLQAAIASSAELKAVPSNLSPSLADAAAEIPAMMFDGCLRLPFQAGQPECATGDTASKTTVAVVGDSHASMWIPAFQQVGKQRPWRIETMAKAACPMMDLPVANRFVSPLVEYLEHCEQWRGQVMDRLRAEHPKLVVVSVFRGYLASHSNGFLSGFSSYDPAWIDSLTRLVQQLRGTGAKVLVLGPLPALNTSVPSCLSEHLDDATACSPPMSLAFNQPGIAAESAAVKAGGAIRRTHRPVLHCEPLPGDRRQHPGLRRRGSHDDRILPAVGPGNGGAGRPRARPRLTGHALGAEQGERLAEVRVVFQLASVGSVTL